MSDIFHEVDEEVRREQIKKIWDQYGNLILVVAALIVLAVGGWRGYQWYQAKQAAAAGAAFEEALVLSGQNKHAEAEAAFAKIAAQAPRGYRALARLRAANEAAQRDPAAAVKLYDEIAGDKGLTEAERDIASLRAAMLMVDTASYDDIKNRLGSIAVSGRIYRHHAREVLAVAALRAGDHGGARSWLYAIVNDIETPQSLRMRAETLQALLPQAANG